MEKYKKNNPLNIIICPEFQLINKCMNMWIFSCFQNNHHKIMYWEQPSDKLKQPLWIFCKNEKKNHFDFYENELYFNQENQNMKHVNQFKRIIKISTIKNNTKTNESASKNKWNLIIKKIYQKISNHIEEKLNTQNEHHINLIHVDAIGDLKTNYVDFCMKNNLKIIHQLSKTHLQNIQNYFIEPFNYFENNQDIDKTLMKQQEIVVKQMKHSIQQKIKHYNEKPKTQTVIQKFKQFVSQYSRMTRCKVLGYSEYMLLEVLMSAYTKTTQIIQPDKEYELLISILKDLSSEEIMHLMSVFMYQIYFKYETRIKEWESCHNLYFIMDTNVLLDLGKNKIETLLILFKSNNIRVVIPNIVMQEIDQLKTKNDPVSKTSRDISEIMYRDFSQESSNTFYVLSSYVKCNRFSNNDDVIIKETLDLQKQKKTSLMTIVTSDKNLLVKCMSKKINCMNINQFNGFCDLMVKK